QIMVDIGRRSRSQPVDDVTESELHRLLGCMLEKAYTSRLLTDLPNSSPLSGSGGSEAAAALLASSNCRELIELDYKLHGCLDNTDGQLCDTYPPYLFLPSSCLRRRPEQELAYPDDFYAVCKSASKARVRGRFPAPALMFEGKLVCRSSALSAWPEAYSRSAIGVVSSWFSSMSVGRKSTPNSMAPTSGESEAADSESVASATGISSNSFFDRTRGKDMALLDCLRVRQIVDLTVEAKFYKYRVPLPLSSTEKIDKRGRYKDYKLCVIPYPGCEFFRVWSIGHGLSMSGVHFAWHNPSVTAQLRFDDQLPLCAVDIDWQRYRDWDLTRLTANYMRLLLGYLVEFPDDGGIMLHCVSGWDRTPMFISLLRCLLWSEGLCHASLSAMQLLYLTLAYDWFLFGHRLPDRMQKDECVLHYCFHFLHSVSRDRHLSMLRWYPHLQKPQQQQQPQQLTDRTVRLRQLCDIFFSAYSNAEKRRAAALAAANSASADQFNGSQLR
ncbi:hypothetical protein BOX15_Mlig008744g1, partial [Macrostomum lignano]